MTPEKLLGLTKSIAEYTDVELEAALKPFFPDTRPKKPTNFILEQANNTSNLSPIQQRIAAEMAKKGLTYDGKPLPRKV